jgi:hypothetical protein
MSNRSYRGGLPHVRHWLQARPAGALADEYLERYRRGERPAATEYAVRHPELVGFMAGQSRHPILGSVGAYEVAYWRLYDAVAGLLPKPAGDVPRFSRGPRPGVRRRFDVPALETSRKT